MRSVTTPASVLGLARPTNKPSPPGRASTSATQTRISAADELGAVGLDCRRLAVVQVVQEHRADIAEGAGQLESARDVLCLLSLRRELDEAEVCQDGVRVRHDTIIGTPSELCRPQIR